MNEEANPRGMFVVNAVTMGAVASQTRLRLEGYPFEFCGGDPVCFVDCCASLHFSSTCWSVLDEVLPDLSVAQSIFEASFLSSRSASTHDNISMEELFWKTSGVYSHQVTALLQLQLPQHGMDAENSGPFQEFIVRDPTLPSQPQYSTETVEMEVFQLTVVAGVDDPDLRPVQKCRKEDDFALLQLGVQLKPVAMSHEGLQPTDGLAGIREPTGNFVVDFCAARDCTSEIGEVFYALGLAAV
ncbi:hypothetical protein SprV_0902756500 [Sparganum proliferum]